MKILARRDITTEDNPEVVAAVCTLLEHLPNFAGLGVVTMNIPAIEQNVLVLLAFNNRDIAELIEQLGIVEDS